MRRFYGMVEGPDGEWVKYAEAAGEYQRGVEAALEVVKSYRDEHAPTFDMLEAAIKRLLGPQETFEQKWLREGYVVTFTEVEPRMYEVRPLQGDLGDGPVVARLPSVQEVDRWVEGHPR